MRPLLRGCASLLGTIVLLGIAPAVSAARVDLAAAEPAVSCAPLDLGEVHSGRTTSAPVDCSGLDLDYTVSSGPAHGSASVDAAGNVSYEADGDYAGGDALEVEARDGGGDTASAQVTVAVVNRPPVCHDAHLAVHRGGSVSVEMDCTDPDGDFLTYEIRRQPAHGSAFASRSGLMGYSADLDFTGTDTFTYGASDALVASADATATVASINKLPACQSAASTIRRDKPWSIQVSCTDGDSDTLTYAISTPPGHGTAELVTDDYATTVIYRPAAGYTGADRVTVSSFDGEVSSHARLDLEVTADHAPVCHDQLRHIHVGATAAVRIVCSDPDVQDAASLRFSLGSAAAHGTLSGLPAGPSAETFVNYTPAAGRIGADAFDVIASDGDLTGRARTRIHVADTPFCDDPPALGVRPGGLVVATVRCTQPADASGALSYRVVRAPARGRVASAAPGDPSFAYTAGEVNGADSFAFVASGSSGTSNTVTQAITISGTRADSPPAGSPPAAGAGASALDTLAPALTLRAAGRQKLRAAARRGVRLIVRATEPCMLSLVARLDGATARRLGVARGVLVARLTRAIAAGTTTVTLKLGARMAKALKRARKVRLRVAMTGTDATGNVTRRLADFKLVR